MRVRGIEHAELLKRNLNGHGEAADAPLVHLGRGVQHHEECEEQRDEVGVADHTVITEINSQFNVASDGSGGGPLETDNSLREVQSQLLGALSFSISGNSGIVNLASIGVNFNNDGTLSVDSGKLASTLSSNFSAVQNLLQNSTNGFSQNLSTVLSNINSPGSGILSLDSQSLNNTSQYLSRQLSDLQAALLVQQANLTSIYSRVNTTLQELPLLESQISQQLASVK
jgi:flagellar hook-associated protein 2